MMKISRRDLLKTSAISTALCFIPNQLIAATNQALRIPPLLENRRGKPILLSMETTQVRLQNNKLVEMWGFNGQYLGPTVRVKKGDFVKLNYRNTLSQSVAINIQGLQTNSDIIGGIGHSLQSGHSWSPIIPINQPAALCYYQSCSLANSAYQNYRGLVGLWIIDDEYSLKSNLPNKYGVNDIPLILQDLQFNSEGEPVFKQNEPHFYGKQLLVNGQLSPYLNVTRGWIRLRLLNASLSRPYELAFDDEREFIVIAKDQSFLTEPQKVKSIKLAIGERLEILVDMSEGGNATLLAGKKLGFFDKLTGLLGSDNQLRDNQILELRPEGLLSAFHQKLNYQLIAPINLPNKITQQRELYIDTNNTTINQKRFDPRRIDIMVKKDNVERWIVNVTSPTSFRIQGAKFLVEMENDHKIQQAELAWKDSIWVDKQVSLLIKFDNLSSNSHPFLFGSGDLMQADRGAIGLILVQ